MAEAVTAAAAAPPAATHSKKPDETSAFKQQRMPAWQPVMSPPWIIGCFVLLGCICIPIGIVIIVASDNIVMVRERYDHLSQCSTLDTGCPVILTLTVPKRMEPPVLIYYELNNFYQNHRRYAKSRSDLQLAGRLPDEGSMPDCDPFLHPGTYRSVPGGTTIKLKGTRGTFDVASVPYNPCGLIAWSMFNDSFALTDPQRNLVCDGALFTASGEPIASSIPNYCEKKGIAWPSDPGVKYVAPPPAQDNDGAPSYIGHHGLSFDANLSNVVDRCVRNGSYIGEEGHRIPDTTDLDLMVWMRLASLSDFRKLYRRINVGLDPGLYTLNVTYRYPVQSFKGKKYFVLTTTSWLGGQNYVLGALYIAAGAVCTVLGLAFLVKHRTTARRVVSL